MKRLAWMVLPFLALAACSSPEEQADASPDDKDVADAQSVGEGSASGAAAAGAAVAINEESDLFVFDYAYPEQAAAIPALKARFDSEIARARTALEKQAREARDEARDQGFPYNAYAQGKTWKVVADTPRFLSLSAEIYSYTGGAHPNSNASSLIWDKEAGRALEALDFFASPADFSAAVEERYCAALNQERSKRRGESVDSEDGLFGACPKAEELVVLLGSSNGKTFDRIGLIAPPYVAGPYVEGEYEVTVPVTEAVIKAVQPAYRQAFSLR